MRIRRLRLADTVLPLFLSPDVHAYSVLPGTGLPADVRIVSARLTGPPGYRTLELLVESGEFADVAAVPVDLDWSGVPEVKVVCREIDRRAELAGSSN